ncbi:hypothetical protein Q9S36_15400 [Microbacterium sp. ARD31]|uniref:hypothetical protein n=1 Tax=Microbacterium sp. ARD31 TaxID=2962576 RepID=UPI002881AF14|nr:hypothetical protein [Microbacterium sp. ARD31]MDT0181561.1 hypothetical protein [Microbacterium sp. ARD31]
MSSAPSRSKPDPLARALDTAATQVLADVVRLSAANPVILIDGRSGAGKSSLARRLVARWPGRGRVQSVAMDSIYPGWDGLDAGVEAAFASILHPHARGLIGVWQRWDWERSEHAEAHAIDPSLPLIVEGAGILTEKTARLADVSVWLDAPAAARRRRALDRDGEAYRPHWERWAHQESVHIDRDDPRARATHVFEVP